MFDRIGKYWHKINPEYHGIIFFLIALFASNWLWKLTVSGEEVETSVAVTFIGIDVSALFGWAVLWFTYASHVLLDFFGVGHTLVNNVICFSNGHALHVVAGCTAIKQSFIAFCILALSRGSWLHKLWYIPVTILILFGFNVVRLALLSLVVRDHMELFDFFHGFVLKYLFYAVVMAIWFFWDEYLRIKLS